MTRRNTNPTSKVKDIVSARADGMCEHCGQLPGEQHHHRLPRRMGGTRRPEVNQPANLLLVNASCHQWLERQGRAWAIEHGLILKDGADPADEPVRLWHGTYLLQDDGAMTPHKTKTEETT